MIVTQGLYGLKSNWKPEMNGMEIHQLRCLPDEMPQGGWDNLLWASVGICGWLYGCESWSQSHNVVNQWQVKTKRWHTWWAGYVLGCRDWALYITRWVALLEHAKWQINDISGWDNTCTSCQGYAWVENRKEDPQRTTPTWLQATPDPRSFINIATPFWPSFSMQNLGIVVCKWMLHRKIQFVCKLMVVLVLLSLV